MARSARPEPPRGRARHILLTEAMSGTVSYVMYHVSTSRSGTRRDRSRVSYAAAAFLLVLAAVAALRGVGQTYVSVLEHRNDGAGSAAAKSVRQLAEGRLPPVGLRGNADFAYLRADALLAHYRAADDREEAAHRGAAAIQGFRDALRLRPVWGKGWARLASAKAVVGEPDTELFQSLAHAVHFAPYEPDVQAMVAWAGLSQWDYLPQPAKQLVWSAITTDKADPLTRRETLRWSVDFGLSEYLAPYLDAVGVRQLEAFRRQRAARDAQNAKGRNP